MTKRLVLTLLLLLLGFSAATSTRPLLIGVTTTTENSGLMGRLLPVFAQTTGIDFRMLVAGTGAVLAMARRGDVDVVLVHAPSIEQRFMQSGYGKDHVRVMRNYYVIVGPPSDPAGVAHATHVLDALQRIAHKKANFASRSDRSGTHVKELELWQRSGLNPDTDEPLWYKKLGQGMGRTLYVASELSAYALSDLATWQANRSRLELRQFLKNHVQLINPYSVITVSPEVHDHVLYEQAHTFVQWLGSPQAHAIIESYQKYGEPLFFVDSEDITKALGTESLR